MNLKENIRIGIAKIIESSLVEKLTSLLEYSASKMQRKKKQKS